MVDNNLAVLLAQRLIKITDVARETGLSRTTLTALYYKSSKNISLHTLDMLCSYLDCSVGDLLILRK